MTNSEVLAEWMASRPETVADKIELLDSLGPGLVFMCDVFYALIHEVGHQAELDEVAERIATILDDLPDSIRCGVGFAVAVMACTVSKARLLKAKEILRVEGN